MTPSALPWNAATPDVGPTGHPGRLEVRLACSAREIDAAQALRYRVFYEEMAAHASDESAARRRDCDQFDGQCDHLLIVDHSTGASEGKVIGTTRLLRRAGAARTGGFYTETEFDISRLLAYEGEIVELGRSCVDAAYRTRAVMAHLWRGIAGYVLRHDIKLMFGCASLPGTDTALLAAELSYLHHHHLAPITLRARALDHRYVSMTQVPPSQIDAPAALARLNGRAGAVALPPLVKGYLRLGGFVGDGAVIDEQFNTTDVCVIVATDKVTEKYFRHYLRIDPT